MVLEAIDFLQNISPVKPLINKACLKQSAKEHAVELGLSGTLTHLSENGETLTDRINKHGVWDVAVAENISVIDRTPREIIISFILDDGNNSRCQRLNLFNEE